MAVNTLCPKGARTILQTLKIAQTTLAYAHTTGTQPGVLFCGGFDSNMEGNKALYLEELCVSAGWQFTRFDYQGHGKSSGRLAEGGLSVWVEDALAVLDQVCVGPQIVVGSSMGGWIATLLSEKRPARVVALLNIAAAPDFTEQLIWNTLDTQTRKELMQGDSWTMPNRYEPNSAHTITMDFINSGRQCLVLDKPLSWKGPARLLHGTADVDVPSTLSQRLFDQLNASDAQLILVKHADHRFSNPEQLTLIGDKLLELRKLCAV